MITSISPATPAPVAGRNDRAAWHRHQGAYSYSHGNPLSPRDAARFVGPLRSRQPNRAPWLCGEGNGCGFGGCSRSVLASSAGDEGRNYSIQDPFQRSV